MANGPTWGSEIAASLNNYGSLLFQGQLQKKLLDQRIAGEKDAAVAAATAKAEKERINELLAHSRKILDDAVGSGNLAAMHSPVVQAAFQVLQQYGDFPTDISMGDLTQLSTPATLSQRQAYEQGRTLAGSGAPLSTQQVYLGLGQGIGPGAETTKASEMNMGTDYGRHLQGTDVGSVIEHMFTNVIPSYIQQGGDPGAFAQTFADVLSNPENPIGGAAVGLMRPGLPAGVQSNIAESGTRQIKNIVETQGKAYENFMNMDKMSFQALLDIAEKTPDKNPNKSAFIYAAAQAAQKEGLLGDALDLKALPPGVVEKIVAGIKHAFGYGPGPQTTYSFAPRLYRYTPSEEQAGLANDHSATIGAQLNALAPDQYP